MEDESYCRNIGKPSRTVPVYGNRRPQTPSYDSALEKLIDLLRVLNFSLLGFTPRFGGRQGKKIRGFPQFRPCLLFR